MSEATKDRTLIEQARRWVVKIGSRSIVGASLHEGANREAGRFSVFADQVQRLAADERSFVLVSSGAVALGRGRLGFDDKPRTMPELQACAAVGQSLLMRGWDQAFRAHETPVAQLLLSHADLADRERYLNARSALDGLLQLGAIPIVNENDTVAVDEIRFGDNDQLASMVCTMAGADLLVLLTDVEGLLNESGVRVSSVSDVKEAFCWVSTSPSDLGSGGMGSKLEAARRASRRGIPVIIADARDDHILSKIAAGEDVGTLVLPQGRKIASRKHWIAYTLRPKGDLMLDAGAVRAITERGKSLLPAGILGVRGNFRSGDVVVLRDMQGAEIGRGLTRYGTESVAKLAGAKSDEIRSRLGFHGGDEVVHRDDLVVA